MISREDLGLIFLPRVFIVEVFSLIVLGPLSPGIEPSFHPHLSDSSEAKLPDPIFGPDNHRP
jgi:hypothetical protein